VKRAGLAVLLLGLALAGALGASLYFIFAARAANGSFGFPLDDAWIHLSFARTLATTGRFADFPAGPLGAGSTSPLFTLLEAIAWRFTHREYVIAYGLGIAGFLASVGLIFWLLKKGPAKGPLDPPRTSAARRSPSSLTRLLSQGYPGARWPAVFGAVALATQTKIVGISVSGMETSTTIALLLLAAIQAKSRRWKTLGVAAGLLLWTRPDTLIFVGCLILHLLYEAAVDKPADRSKMPQALLTFGALALGYFAFNWALSGTLFPNSLAAKLEYYRFGNNRFGADLWAFLTAGGMAPATLLFLVGLFGTLQDLARRRPAPSLYAHLFVVALIAAYGWKLPFLYQDGRYLIPVIPFVLVGTIDGGQRLLGAARFLSRDSDPSGRIVKAFSVAVPLLAAGWIVGLDLWRLPVAQRDFAARVRHIADIQVAAALWCRDHLPRTAIIATHDIGALGFYSGRPIVDVVGLLDRGIHGHIGDPEATLEFMRARRVTHLAFLTNWIEVPNENPLMRTTSAQEEVMQVLPLTPSTRISSRIVMSLNLFAEQCLSAGDAKRALAALAEASRIEPANARTHYLAGLAFVKLSALDRAEHELETSLRDFPNSSKALSALGQLAYHRGSNTEAAALLRRAVAEDPLNTEALTVLVDVVAKLPDQQADLPALRARLQSAMSAR
jgi:hypothetical protein